MEETASSLEELTATVRKNSENARHSNQLAQEAARGAARGSATVANVVNIMESIRAPSNRIADIIRVIDGIAFLASYPAATKPSTSQWQLYMDSTTTPNNSC